MVTLMPRAIGLPVNRRHLPALHQAFEVAQALADIVARRLRKAAEQETDPELKEKLWKEYIEYKKNGQGK